MPQKKPVNPLLKNTLISLLSFLKHKAEDQNLDPVISVAKVVDILKNSTKMILTYQQLVDLTQDPIIASSIKSINKNQIEIALSSDESMASSMGGMDMGGEDFDMGGEEGNDDEEFNPDDFAMPEEGEEGVEEEPPAPAQEVQPENEMGNQNVQFKPNPVMQMAKRAAGRR